MYSRLAGAYRSSSEVQFITSYTEGWFIQISIEKFPHVFVVDPAIRQPKCSLWNVSIQPLTSIWAPVTHGNETGVLSSGMEMEVTRRLLPCGSLLCLTT